MKSWLVHPSSSTGNGRRIELPGLDLWIIARIDSALVYPGALDIDRFNNALSRTLALWPIVCGRFLLVNNGEYVIEMSDKPIPVSYVENNELTKWPVQQYVVQKIDDNPLVQFIDEVNTMKLVAGSAEEPLVCFKLTRIVKSNEWVLGISWEHVLGDADSCLRFANTISRIYQNLSTTEPSPIFERRLWRNDEVHMNLLPMMKQQRDALNMEAAMAQFMETQAKYEQVNIQFSGEQLKKLRKLAGDNSVTIQDSLTAYIITLLNRNCYKSHVDRIILRANTTVNYRGVSDSIAKKGEVSNAVMMMLSEDFDDPFSISHIAKKIRSSIIRSRDPNFLVSWLATANKLMKDIVINRQIPKVGYFPNEASVNSNYRYDWVDLVDFGYKDGCRYYTAWTAPLYLRVYHLNPILDDLGHCTRDKDGAEVAFLIEKDMKEIFLRAYQQDMAENFKGIQQ